MTGRRSWGLAILAQFFPGRVPPVLLKCSAFQVQRYAVCGGLRLPWGRNSLDPENQKREERWCEVYFFFFL